MAILTNSRQEIFVQNWFKGKTKEQSALIAGYAAVRARQTGCRLATFGNVLARYNELQAQVCREGIADFEERQKILTEISRGKLSQFTDNAGVIDRTKLDSSAIQGMDEQTVMGKTAKVIKLRLHNPINAISELNKMDHVYEASQGYQDNRTINFILLGERSKELIDKIKEVTSGQDS